MKRTGSALDLPASSKRNTYSELQRFCERHVEPDVRLCSNAYHATSATTERNALDWILFRRNGTDQMFWARTIYALCRRVHIHMDHRHGCVGFAWDGTPSVPARLFHCDCPAKYTEAKRVWLVYPRTRTVGSIEHGQPESE